MTDTHIDALIEAVRAGDMRATVEHAREVFPFFTIRKLVLKACDGDLNAAATLHKALLPGWEHWVSSKHYWDGEEGPIAFLRAGTSGVDLKVVQAKSTDLARAWLLAVLKAYRTQVETQG